MSFSVDLKLDVRCVRCGRERELPENDRPRLPAVTKPGEGVTLQTDERCRCGARRVRVKVDFATG